MFNFFKRFAAPPKKPATASRPPSSRKPASRRSANGPLPGYPLPAPEVVEGNDHTDWDLWEDSVNALDSRMQGLTPSTKIYNSKAQPSQFDDLDIFSRVTKNRDL
jgi:hypothetical protein